MKHNYEKRYRKSIRKRKYNYSRPGRYFVTICTKERECLFGDIVNSIPQLSPIVKIVRKCWCAIPQHFQNTRLDEFVIMPNHIHGIIIITRNHQYSSKLNFTVGTDYNLSPQLICVPSGSGTDYNLSLRLIKQSIENYPTLTISPIIQNRFQNVIPQSLSYIIATFKSAVTRNGNKDKAIENPFVWQTRFFDRIIRNKKELYAIRNYIKNNPERWDFDQDNPNTKGESLQ